MESTATTTDIHAELQALRAELAQKRTLVELLLDNNPDGIAILGADGTMNTNEVGSRVLGAVPANTAPGDWSEGFGYFAADRVTRKSFDELPAVRAARGETIVDELLYCVGATAPDGVMLSCSARPLPGGGSITVFRDVTERVKLESELATRNDALAKREEENRELIERLRVALDELSTPVLEVAEDVLVLPVIGLVDTQRSAAMSERLLAEVVRTRSKHVIVDLTGVELIDTGTADRFAKLARAVELLGASCVLSGLQPAVAQTLVELGVEFSGLDTQRNLRHALEHTMRARRALKTRDRERERGTAREGR
ncbi:STAS domain-containing protein [Sandaracinus amylolyticus]|uniref:RsbR, positive regulator of sigma-B n=1 Tax=Sandaracinus amylolyticus TaxID=927083 RepID=A0A0F6W5P0_9BACT|nr:STAS domain-containing protein [Sandaracinus amylolyticus]AKF07915.1 RsbR, positive regulator of sigma-B [Sandaracinus amylolyticus]